MYVNHPALLKFNSSNLVYEEILTCDVPYRRQKSDALVMFSIIRKELPDKPRDMSEPMKQLWKICKRCWRHSPKRRIVIEDVLAQFKNIDLLSAIEAIVGPSASSPSEIQQSATRELTASLLSALKHNTHEHFPIERLASMLLGSMEKANVLQKQGRFTSAQNQQVGVPLMCSLYPKVAQSL